MELGFAPGGRPAALASSAPVEPLEQQGLSTDSDTVTQRMFLHPWEREPEMPEKTPEWAVTQNGKLMVFIQTGSAARCAREAGQSLEAWRPDMLAADMTNN